MACSLQPLSTDCCKNRVKSGAPSWDLIKVSYATVHYKQGELPAKALDELYAPCSFVVTLHA